MVCLRAGLVDDSSQGQADSSRSLDASATLEVELDGCPTDPYGILREGCIMYVQQLSIRLSGDNLIMNSIPADSDADTVQDRV